MNKRYFKCRCTKRTKKWIDIKTWDAEAAAAKYAERCYCDGGSVVTVMKHGRWLILTEIHYDAMPEPTS